jgi:RNA polymerase sigma-70 factor (ECF subfamily)
MILLDAGSCLTEIASPEGSSSAALPSVEQVFRPDVPRLSSLARRLMGNEADAEDVVSDVLVQVLRKVGTFRGQSELATWLHRVTVNAALMQRRKQARRRQREVSTLGTLDEERALRCPSPDREGPDQRALRRETQMLLEQAIAGLSELYRDVYVLADVEHLPSAEIGGLLGLSLAAVKSRLHRARLLMRRALAPYFQAPALAPP